MHIHIGAEQQVLEEGVHRLTKTPRQQHTSGGSGDRTQLTTMMNVVALTAHSVLHLHAPVQGALHPAVQTSCVTAACL